MHKMKHLHTAAFITLITLCFASCGSDDESSTTSGSNTYTASDCSSLTGNAKVVCLANNFLATLSTSQLSDAVITLNLTNAKKWSNLPGGVSIRNGVEFSSLSSTQLAAALEVIKAASGTTSNNGYDEFNSIRLADTYLSTVGGGSNYSEGEYIIAFLGTPSTTGKWQLQFGGHHYAQNITYDAGVVTSITPSHQGVEPVTWTTSGTTYAPMTDERSGMAEMLASFSTAELATAKISSTFTDCLMVPGSTTNSFPSTKQGIQVSTLSAAAQAKVLAAMMPWINDLDAASAASFTSLYTNELAGTYVTYASNSSGSSGNAGSFLTANTDYVRIDGPSVWIEFICQSGVVLSGIHYHTVFRDHNRDYIGL